MKFINTLIFSLICSLSFAQVNLSEGLIASYPFSGNVNDESGNGNHGIVNGATLTDDRFGNENQAYFFDGENSYIVIDPVSNVSEVGDFSLSLWAYCKDWKIQPIAIDGVIAHPYIFDGHSHSETVSSDFLREGFMVTYKLKEDGQQYVVNSTLDFDSESFINDMNTDFELKENWVHIVFIRSGGMTYHYVNGELIASNVNNISSLDMQHKWFVGTFSGNNPNYNNTNYNFYGIIDDINIYNRALNESEIMTLFASEPFAIRAGSENIQSGQEFTLPVYTSYLTEVDNVSAYQFDLTYDESIMEFLDSDLSETVSENGSIDINSSTDGLLRISFMTSDALIGDSLLLKLNFKSISPGISNITLSDVLYNTESVNDITNGTIIAASLFGDVDGNMEVQAYDASLALKNSVGLDPLPEIDPIPWESWRVINADVDGVEGITASDAAFILQKTTGNISQFPVESSKKSLSASNENIEIIHEDGKLSFYAPEGLFGLNVFIEVPDFLELSEPLVLNESFISATNINGSVYYIGLATAYAPVNGEKIMEIPLTVKEEGSLDINLIVNTTYRNSNLNFVATGNFDPNSTEIKVYPNPASEIISISGLQQDSEIYLYTLEGKEVIFKVANNSIQELNIDGLKPGVYLLKIKNNNTVSQQKIIKK